MNAGIFDGKADGYHADQHGDHLTLSSSIANLLINRSPLHAWTAHPRLNPSWQPDDDSKYDVGTVAHSMLLEGAANVDVCDYDSWRSNDAKEARDQSRANGRTPLLTHQFHEVINMCNAVAEQLKAFDADPVPLTGGTPEQTMVWQDPATGVWCRARIDWLHDDLSAIDDLKTTTRLAHPEAFAKNLYSYGCDVQAAFYLRGMRALHPDSVFFDDASGKALSVAPAVQWRWIVVETSPPYGLSVVEPGPAVLELADAKVDAALKLWAECLERNVWPGYPTKVATAELPAWEEARWLAREEA
jgi:hypothetical protein